MYGNASLLHFFPALFSSTSKWNEIVHHTVSKEGNGWKHTRKMYLCGWEGWIAKEKKKGIYGQMKKQSEAERWREWLSVWIEHPQSQTIWFLLLVIYALSILGAAISSSVLVILTSFCANGSMLSTNNINSTTTSLVFYHFLIPWPSASTS